MGRRGFFYLVIGLVVGLLVAQLPGTFANMGMGGSGMMGPMHGRGMSGGMMMGHMMHMMHGDVKAGTKWALPQFRCSFEA